MKPIRLVPAKHQAPVCEAYDDEREVRRFERAVREHRAYSEAFRVVPLDGRVDGAYRVTGESGAPYQVDIVDGSGQHDACSCADFLANELGTCKHVEAVRRGVARVPELWRAFQRLPQLPRRPVLTVNGIGPAALRAVGAWADADLALLGLMRRKGEPEVVFPLAASDGRLLSTSQERNQRVVHAAVVLAERLRRAGRNDDRCTALSSALASGALGLDVLSVPLFPYQRDGVAHLLRAGRALLADDMGLGKTAQAIAACELLRARGEASRILVVTLASLKHQWAREIQRFAGVPAVVVGGGASNRRHALESDAPYKILNYELTWRELSALKGLDADVVIYDEAQRAKNFRTKTARTIQQIPSRFSFVLTGTPLENRLDDLYSLMQVVDPRVFGPLWKFNLEFHQQDETGKIVGYKNLSELRARTGRVVLRRRKEEILTQLPALTEQTRYTPLTTVQQELEQGYRQTAGQLMAKAARGGLTKKEQELLMMNLLKARQACNAAELCDSKRRGSPKLDEFEALISEICSQGTSKVLVFSEWVEMLKLAAQRLDSAGIGYVMLHGGVPTERRPALLDRFRESDDVRVLLSTEAGGTGLNLQDASYVVHLDLPWNPGRLDQRTARAHRMGQTRGVSVIYLCAEQGIERAIEGTLAGKRAERSAALDGASTVETLEAPSFTLFLSQIQELMDELADADGGVELDESTETLASDEPTGTARVVAFGGDVPAPAPAPSQASPVSSGGLRQGDRAAVQSNAPSTSASVLRVGEVYAQRRLILARVVLDAGFAADAVRAAYEALSATIGALLTAPPASHAARVAGIYGELLPSGRLPHGAHGALARLHDLTLLEAHGVEVNPELARAAVDEAGEWLVRVAASSCLAPSGSSPALGAMPLGRPNAVSAEQPV
jgi:superfamily II DNA or RNA helicase